MHTCTHTHTHTHNFSLLPLLRDSKLQSLVYESTYAASTLLWHQCSVAKGGGGGWEEGIASLGCSSAAILQEAVHVPVSSQTPAAACFKPGHAAPRRVRESPPGNSCLFLGILDSSIYLGRPRSESQDPALTWALPPAS
jgi:hypothetical protein